MVNIMKYQLYQYLFFGANNTSSFFNEAPMRVLFIQRKHACLCVCVLCL